jgi:hypothetical protein
VRQVIDMEIMCIEVVDLDEKYDVIYFRIKREAGTEKQYNRYKDYLRETLGFGSVKGFGERTVIYGKGYIMNVVRSKDYMHVVVTAQKPVREKIMDIVKFFDVTEYNQK